MSILEIAHRGYSEVFKDNTINSLKAAVDNNFDMIELDIQLTKDEKIIIFHDTYIKDSNEKSHLIIDLTYQEILMVDKEIPLINDLFIMLKYKNLKKFPIYLDIKGTKRIVPYLVNFLNEIHNDYDLNNIFIGSFNILLIQELYKLNKNLNYGIISETMFTDDVIQIFINKYKLKFFSFHWSVLQHNEIKYLKDRNIKVFTYTNKLEIIYKRIKEFNVDGIVTNFKIK